MYPPPPDFFVADSQSRFFQAPDHPAKPSATAQASVNGRTPGPSSCPASAQPGALLTALPRRPPLHYCLLGCPGRKRAAAAVPCGHCLYTVPASSPPARGGRASSGGPGSRPGEGEKAVWREGGTVRIWAASAWNPLMTSGRLRPDRVRVAPSL